jgi:hypothetical protein
MVKKGGAIPPLPVHFHGVVLNELRHGGNFGSVCESWGTQSGDRLWLLFLSGARYFFARHVV